MTHYMLELYQMRAEYLPLDQTEGYLYKEPSAPWPTHLFEGQWAWVNDKIRVEPGRPDQLFEKIVQQGYVERVTGK